MPCNWACASNYLLSCHLKAKPRATVPRGCIYIYPLLKTLSVNDTYTLHACYTFGSSKYLHHHQSLTPTASRLGRTRLSLTLPTPLRGGSSGQRCGIGTYKACIVGITIRRVLTRVRRVAAPQSDLHTVPADTAEVIGHGLGGYSGAFSKSNRGLLVQPTREIWRVIACDHM